MASIFFKIVRIYCNQFKCNYLKKHFLNFLLHFWNLHSISNFLKKKMTFIAYVFWKLQTARNVARQKSEKTRYFRTPFESQSQHDQGFQTLPESPWHFYHIFSSLLEIVSGKMSLLVICEILRVFVNTFTADDKYFLQNSQNLPQPIQMQLSKTQKTFSQCFAPFLKFTFHFKFLERKDDLHSLCISEITDFFHYTERFSVGKYLS